MRKKIRMGEWASLAVLLANGQFKTWGKVGGGEGREEMRRGIYVVPVDT